MGKVVLVIKVTKIYFPFQKLVIIFQTWENRKILPCHSLCLHEERKRETEREEGNERKKEKGKEGGRGREREKSSRTVKWK